MLGFLVVVLIEVVLPIFVYQIVRAMKGSVALAVAAAVGSVIVVGIGFGAGLAPGQCMAEKAARKAMGSWRKIESPRCTDAYRSVENTR